VGLTVKFCVFLYRLTTLNLYMTMKQEQHQILKGLRLESQALGTLHQLNGLIQVRHPKEHILKTLPTHWLLWVMNVMFLFEVLLMTFGKPQVSCMNTCVNLKKSCTFLCRNSSGSGCLNVTLCDMCLMSFILFY